MHRVAVTGCGVVSGLGAGLQSFEDALFTGRSGIRPINGPWPGSLRISSGAPVDGYVAAEHFDAKRLALLDPFAQYAVAAAREAVQRAGIRFVPHRTAVIAGSGGGGQYALDESYADLYARNNMRVNPLTVPRVMSSAAVSHVAMEFGITGPAFTVSSACSSSNHAIGHAFWMIRHGLCEAAITGGSEAVFTFGCLKAWEAMRVVSPTVCRPFSKDRDGMTLGEGAAMLVIEDYDSARARGAEILADMVGFGMSSDAHHITQPSAAGAASAMRMALEDAGLAPEQIDYVNAHGTGTQANDATETAALHEVFGDHAKRLLVSSTKSMHGHALGAAGALEAVASILALHKQTAPPTANFTEPDPACDLDYVPNAPRRHPIGYVMSNSFAFGGLNAVLIFAVRE